MSGPEKPRLLTKIIYVIDINDYNNNCDVDIALTQKQQCDIVT